MKQFKLLLLTALCCMLLIKNSRAASHVTLSLANATSTSNAFEFDVFIINDGTTQLNLKAYQFGLNFNLGIMNGGTGTYTYLPGTRDSIFSILSLPSSQYSNFQLKQYRSLDLHLPASRLPPEYRIVWGDIGFKIVSTG